MNVIVIPGKPIPLARPRRAKNGGMYDSQKCEKMAVQMIMKRYNPEFLLSDSPLFVEMVFYFNTPKRKGESHTGRPDVDNLVKFYLDCLNGILIKDDKYVSSLYCRKEFCDVEETIIRICSLAT